MYNLFVVIGLHQTRPRSPIDTNDPVAQIEAVLSSQIEAAQDNPVGWVWSLDACLVSRHPNTGNWLGDNWFDNNPVQTRPRDHSWASCLIGLTLDSKVYADDVLTGLLALLRSNLGTIRLVSVELVDRLA